jgi:uncharacterized membrane protein YphA (DoxX/SURF4 family)
MIDAPLQLIVALGLALLFASAGVHKLRNGPRFTAALAEYHLLPTHWTPALARALALLEILLAAALLLPLSRPGAGVLAAALLTLYAGAITINLARGRSYIDCGCGDRPQLLSPWLLLRNGLLAAGALLLMLPAAPYAFAWTDLVFYVPAFLLLCLLYLVGEELLENASILREWSELRD